MENYQDLDGLALAEAIAHKKLSATEALEEAMALADRRNPSLNAIIMRHDDMARANAQQNPQGVFGGVPFLLKNLHTLLKDTSTDGGSAALQNKIADHDSTLVGYFKKAGLVIFGKTNSPEFGLTGTTEPRLYGATHNPWGKDLSPAGSSGGAAAAVAAGIVPIAHASDGGGSIRLPAAACGLFGMKPSRARVTFAPDRGEGWAGMSCNHIVSRSVRDSAAMLDAVAMPAAGDPYFAPAASMSFLEATRTTPAKLKIAFNAKRPDGSDPDPIIAALVEETAKKCEALGHSISEAAPTYDPSETGRHQVSIIGANVAAMLSEIGRARGKPIDETELERASWRAAEFGRMLSAEDYINAINHIHALGRKVAAFHETYDIYLSPVFAVTSFKLGELDMMSDDLGTYNAALMRIMPYTGLANITGQPSMSVPLGWSEAETPVGMMPIGMMFTARIGEEVPLFQLAAQLENAYPWQDRYQKLWQISPKKAYL